MTEMLEKSRTVYSKLLFAYPPEFRQQFGPEMVATFSDQMLDEWQQNGVAGLILVWRSSLWELFSVAMPLQLRRSIVIATALSFLSTSVLFLMFSRAVFHQCAK
jgi:hypothetical protein